MTIDSIPQDTKQHNGQNGRKGQNGPNQSPPCNNMGGAIPQEAVLGGETAILRHGIDTAYWYCAIPAEAVLDSINKAETAIAEGWPGWAKGGVSGYAYTYSSEGLRVLIPSAAGLHMGLYIMAGAAWCLGHQPRAYEATIDGVLMGVFGIKQGLKGLRLSRVDLAFDAAGVAPEFTPANIVSRAKSRATYYTGEALTGAAIGKGDVRFRLYDKTVEAAQSGHLDMWVDAWGGYEGEVWRAEYQLRGEFLRQYHVDTISEFLAVAGDMMEYLQTWVRFAEVQGHKGVERPLLSWWAELMAAVDALALSVIGAVRDFRKKMPDLAGLKAQLIGLAAAASAAYNINGGAMSPLEFLADLIFTHADRIAIKATFKAAEYQERMYA